MKLDENYTLIGDESQWTLYYEKKYFDEKKKKEVVSKNSYYFNKMSDAISSYIDKKLKEKETVFEVIEGLKTLLNIADLKKIDSNAISFGVAPRINACGRMGFQEEALQLFLTEDSGEATKIAKRLVQFNQERQAKEKQIFEEVIEKIEKDENKLLVYLNTNLESAELNSYLFQQNITLTHLVKRKHSLEEQFLELTKQS